MVSSYRTRHISEDAADSILRFCHNVKFESEILSFLQGKLGKYKNICLSLSQNVKGSNGLVL